MTDSDLPGAVTEASSAVAAAESAGVEVTRLTPVFKLVFLTVLGLTVLAFIANIALVLMLDNPNDQAKGLIETCSTITKAGFGAIVGLVGGKAV